MVGVDVTRFSSRSWQTSPPSLRRAVAHKYPDYDLDANKGAAGAVWTIENDAFMRFCEMAMDSEKQIRSKVGCTRGGHNSRQKPQKTNQVAAPIGQAMNYIGTFRHVKEAFILQTLNKQSITNFRRPAPQMDQIVS